MSVSVEPLHFTQQAPSPSFSSPPQSPNHHLHAQTPTPAPAPAPTDVDMSSSNITSAPAGQRHDRDADMQDGDGLANGHVEEPPMPPSERGPDTNTIAVEVAAMDDDAMDTTPDVDTEVVLADASVGPLEATPTPDAPATNGADVGESGNDQTPPAVTPTDNTVSHVIHDPEATR